MNQHHKSLIDTVKARLTKAGLNQSELADAMGISQAYVSDLMHGRRGMTPSLVGRVSIALKLSRGDHTKVNMLGARASGWDI